MKIIDRYVIRQVLMPFCIGLLVFTFLLIIGPLIENAETFIAKGVPIPVVVQVIATLLPSTLSLTIPMSLLLGLLVGFGRLSSDREFVAMQACGISLSRLLVPVGLLSVLCWAATSYVLLVALPESNQRYREITFRLVAERAEGEVKPRIFFNAFPDLVLYVREVPRSGGWNGVFMVDERPNQTQSVYLARRGHVFINREKKTVEMVLEDGEQHIADSNGQYRVVRFGRAVTSIDPSVVFPRQGPPKDVNEMTIPELQARIAEMRANGESTHRQEIGIHQKFSIPLACFVFAVIGLALGATHRRDGSLGAFVLGVVVVFVYYIPLYLGPQMAKGHLIPPWLAAWLPNIVLGAGAAALFLWRDRVADGAFRLPRPAFLRRPASTGARRVRMTVPLPFLTIIDRYVAVTYGRILTVSALAMAAIFYISTFIDLSDKVFKGSATWGMLARYFWYSTPQYVYFIIPLSVLLAAVVTIGALTKNSELIVMKACGISLYRIAMPMIGCAAVGAAVLFGLEQTVLGAANEEAQAIRLTMNGAAPNSANLLGRRWLMAANGTIYHYQFFDPRRGEMTGLETFDFTSDMTRLVRRTYAAHAVNSSTAEAVSADWQLERGWSREFDDHGEPRNYLTFDRRNARLESPSYFGTKEPEPKFMSYSQLRAYIERLKVTGFDVAEQQVALARKAAFPFVTLVMTLIAVPFGVTTGRSGAMAGIGVGIALAVTYWTAISIFAALGTGGVLPPALAVWSPNLLFGAAAAYLLFTVRT